jgi:hypothetical protein
MSQEINLSLREGLSIREYLSGQLAAFFASMPPVHLIGPNSAPTMGPFHRHYRQGKVGRLDFMRQGLRSGQKASSAVHGEDHAPLIAIQDRTVNFVPGTGAP